MEEVKRSEVQFKHLLVYFSILPRIAIACRLADIEWKLENYQMSSEAYEELNSLCRGGPFFIEIDGEMNGILNVKIFDFDQRCLNDVVVEKGLAVCTLLFDNNVLCIFQFSSSSQLNMPILPTTTTKNGDNQQ
jgi:hypothetical protein